MYQYLLYLYVFYNENSNNIKKAIGFVNFMTDIYKNMFIKRIEDIRKNDDVDIGWILIFIE